MVGGKRRLKPRDVWAIRFFLDDQRCLRDLGAFRHADRQQASGVRYRQNEDRRHRDERYHSKPCYYHEAEDMTSLAV